MNVPGLKIAVPSTPYDAKGLLKTAIRDDDPVVFLEARLAYYRVKGEVPEEEYTIPFGQARVAREGTDVTIVAWQKTYHDSLAAAEELFNEEGINVEIIDPRTLVPLDKTTILNSVKKTGRAIIAHEAPKRGGAGGEISAIIAEEAAEYLKAPIRRVAGANIPIPFGITELQLVPDKDAIKKAVVEIMKKNTAVI
jgi:pyruvate dehydrogenase E1 component beta subunit